MLVAEQTVTTDEERVLLQGGTEIKLCSYICRSGSCENLLRERKKFIFCAFINFDRYMRLQNMSNVREFRGSDDRM